MEEQGTLILFFICYNYIFTIYSWLYNLFDDQIADSIKSSLSDSLCSTAVEYIYTSGNAAVEKIPCKHT